MNNKKLKALIEKRGEISAKLNGILAAAENEVRALSDEEKENFEALEKELADIDSTLDMEKRAAAAAAFRFSVSEPEAAAPGAGETEVRASREIVNDYVRGNELRAGEMSTTSTGGIIPSDFSKDIISKTLELSGILNRITVVNSKGEYKQIVADDEHKMSSAWTGELQNITKSSAQFKTIKIGHYKLTSTAILSLELINQNEFDIVSEIERQMLLDFSLKAETAIIKGTGDDNDQPTGLVTSGTAYALPSGTSITADDIVKIYHSLKSPYQQNAVWLMSNSTLCAIRLLTDGAGRYIFHQSENLTSGYMGFILGKPVLVSEAMDNLEAEKKPILFGDFGRAYKANINPALSIQMLNEQFALQGAKGIVSIMWLGGKPVNEEAYVTVSCAAATSGGSEAASGSETE